MNKPPDINGDLRPRENRFWRRRLTQHDHLPQMNTFLHLTEDGKDKFDEALAQGLPLFHENHPMEGF